jgi:hypothetical protein
MKEVHWLYILVAILIVTSATNNFLVNSYMDSLTGRAVTNTGTLSIGVFSPCTITLQPGWNLISICSNASNTSLLAVLNPISSQYSLVKEWNYTTQAFMTYHPSSPSPPFTHFDLNKSYFILYNGSTATAFSVSGSEFPSINITLLPNWTTPTYPYIFVADMFKYLATITGDYSLVKKWNSTTQGFVTYSPMMVTPPFQNISVGEGQFILVNNTLGTVLVYNKSGIHA